MKVLHEYGLLHAYEATVRLLPRADNTLKKIRPKATYAIIIVSDEMPKMLLNGEYDRQSPEMPKKGITLDSKEQCILTADDQKKLSDFLTPWKTLFGGTHPTYGADGKAIVNFIGGLCASDKDCISIPGHGYLDLVRETGGISADLCQADLGASLQTMIDTITGAASSAKLQYVPISASLAVAIDKMTIPRSRVQGFDYVGFSNTLVFSGMDIPLGTQIVASYRRWVQQAIIY